MKLEQHTNADNRIAHSGWCVR